MNSGKRKFAAAAIIAIAAYIGVSQFSGHRTAAFADTMEQIEKARSVVFTETFCNEDGTKRFSTRQLINERGILRSELDHGTVIIYDFTQGVTLQLEPNQKHAILTYRVGKERPARPSTHLDWATTLHEGGKLTGKEQIGGKTTNVFVAEERFEKTTVWVDPQTDLPVRAMRVYLRNPRPDIIVPKFTLSLQDFGGTESLISSLSGSISGQGIQESQIIVDSDFMWNVDLDESLFSLEPPPDYTVEKKQFDVTDRGDLCLIDALSLWTEMSDGVFPASIDDLIDPNLAKPLLIARFDRDGDPKEELRQAMAAAHVLMKASWFAQEHKARDNWWYAGGGVQLGEADKAICWWKQEGSQTYRVIYGNLHIGDATEPPQLP